MLVKRHWRWFIVVTVAATVAACRPPERKPTIPPPPDEPEITYPQLPENLPFNIGDVEQQCLSIEASLAPQSVSPSIEVTEERDRLDILKIVKIDVTPPYPKELWLSYQVKSKKDLADHPVVLRAEVLADDRGVGSFALLLAEGAKKNTFEKQVNVLEGLDSVPKSIGVRVAPVAVLFPEGTDPATIDPETAETDEMSEAIYFAFVRINFLPESDEPSPTEGL